MFKSFNVYQDKNGNFKLSLNVCSIVDGSKNSTTISLDISSDMFASINKIIKNVEEIENERK